MTTCENKRLSKIGPDLERCSQYSMLLKRKSDENAV